MDFVTIKPVATNFEAILSTSANMAQLAKIGEISFVSGTVGSFTFLGCDTLRFEFSQRGRIFLLIPEYKFCRKLPPL